MARYILPFKPLLGIASGYWQTIIASYGLPLSDPPSTSFIVPATDHDQLVCVDSTPPGWTPELPIIVLAHGLGGSSRSRYIVRLTRYLYKKGQRVIRVNFRGCGLGEGYAKQLSHAGRSEDLLAVCQMLKNQNPDTKIKIVGFSLAGNILLKMLGELGTRGQLLIDSALAICPLVDLRASSIYIADPEKRIFENFYLECLKLKAAQRIKIFPDFPRVSFPEKLSLYIFDNIYTAPLSGYNNADEYYETCSCKRFIHKIAVPTKILYAKDDPIIPSHTIEDLNLPPCVTLYSTEYGGHVGYLSWTGFKFWLRWMDKQVIEWLDV